MTRLSMKAARPGVLVVTAVLLHAGVVRADGLDACIQAAVRGFGDAGAPLDGEPVRGFLAEGQHESVHIELDEDGCAGFLAVGHRRVRDLDLALYTDTGIELSRDVEVDAHPYVRYCGTRGLALVLSVHMYAGHGEYQLLRFDNAPARLPDLNRTAGGCFAMQAGVQSGPADVGLAPSAQTASQAMEVAAERLGALGHRLVGVELRGSLRPHQQRTHSLRLPSGGCYVVVVASEPSMRRLEMQVRGLSVRAAGRAEPSSPLVTARFCVNVGAGQEVILRSAAGAGDYRLRAFRATEAPGPRPAGLEGASRIEYAEAAHKMRARGMLPEVLAWGMLLPGQSLAMVTELRAGRCYAFAAVRGPELVRASVDLMLMGDDEIVLARHIGGAAPMLYHCATRTGAYRVIGRVRGGAGRYLVVRGEDR